MKFFSDDKYKETIEQIKKDAAAKAEQSLTKRVEELEKSIKRKNKELEEIKETYEDHRKWSKRSIQKLEDEVAYHEKNRDDAREILAGRIANEDKEAVLDAKLEALADKEARLKDRESKIGVEEEGEYKRGYADGLSDGLRKAHDITSQDRADAMKIAMVSASSHTPISNLKEINSAFQLTAGSED